MATHFLSLSMKNRFSFKCPVMNADVEMRSCVLLRDKVYVGKRLETRRGCQACISAGKCPAAEMVRRVAFGANNATDHCASDEPRMGRIPADVLERIAPVLVPESTFRNYGVAASEVLAIQSSRDRIEAQITTAPRERVEGRATRSQVSNHTPTKRKPVSEQKSGVSATVHHINKAAASGDMAAALNAA